MATIGWGSKTPKGFTPSEYTVSGFTGEVTLKGFEGVLEALNEFTFEVEKRIGKTALLAGAKIGKAQARANVDAIIAHGTRWERWGQYKGQVHMAGMLYRHVGAWPKRDRKTGQLTARFGTASRAGVAYGLPLERGHKMYINGKYTGGHVAAYPWLRQVLAQKGAAITSAIEDSLRKNIARWRSKNASGK